MKHSLLTSFFAILSIASFGQITNGDFENWTVAGNCSSPDNWGTLNGSTGILGICTAQEETSNPHSGNSALLINTQFIGFPINQTAPGIVTNGTINTSTQMVEGGQAFTERPTSFTGWYRATPVNNDTYSFSALLINEASGDTVGSAQWEGSTTVSSWTQFSAPVAYTSQDNPTLLQIILLPSDPNNPQVGSEAVFDDLDYETLTVGMSEQALSMINTYPNPVVDQVYFNLGDLEQANLVVYNILGVKILETGLTTTNNLVDMSGFANGTYVWQLADVDGQLIKTGKLLVTK